MGNPPRPTAGPQTNDRKYAALPFTAPAVYRVDREVVLLVSLRAQKPQIRSPPGRAPRRGIFSSVQKPHPYRQADLVGVDYPAPDAARAAPRRSLVWPNSMLCAGSVCTHLPPPCTRGNTSRRPPSVISENLAGTFISSGWRSWGRSGSLLGRRMRQSCYREALPIARHFVSPFGRISGRNPPSGPERQLTLGDNAPTSPLLGELEIGGLFRDSIAPYFPSNDRPRNNRPLRHAEPHPPPDGRLLAPHPRSWFLFALYSTVTPALPKPTPRKPKVRSTHAPTARICNFRPACFEPHQMRPAKYGPVTELLG